MKITKEDYNILKEGIKNSPISIAQQRLNILNSGRQPKDFDKRLRWDILWYSEANKHVNKLYMYLNDDHIDSALKAIMKEIDN